MSPTTVSVPSIWTMRSKLSIAEIRWTLKNGWMECLSFSAYQLPANVQMRFRMGPVTSERRS